MAEWTHRVCERCWFDGNERLVKLDPSDQATWELVVVEPLQGEFDGAFRLPVQVKDIEPGPCCVCGGMTLTGIFTRKHQSALLCQGRHEPEQYGARAERGR